MLDDREPESMVTRRALLKTTAVAGVAGVGTTGTASAGDWKKLRFKAAGKPVFRYHVSVSGKLKREPNRDGFDTLVDENTAKGAASKGRFDDWRFTGKITKLKLEGPGMVIVDGKVIEDTTKKDRKDEKDRKDHEDFDEITFCASGKETFSYKVTVTGKVKRGGRFGTDDGDEIIDGNTGKGAVSKGRCDSWLFSGKPKNLEVSGPGKVFVNGKLVEDTSKEEKKH